ncbi:MAG: hypothetical protein RQ748_05700 [Elusimicrobiales bacterium]|nr:hypothetical protein [Elusimicrobiales bacterium]
MKKLLAVLFGSLFVFAAALPYAAAQDEGMDEELEIEEAFEGGPGMGMGPGGRQGPMGGPDMMGRDQRQMKVKVRKTMRPGMGEGRFGRQDMEGAEEKVLDLIKKHDSSFHAKLLKLRESAPAKYKVAMRMSGKVLLMAKMDKDPVLEKNAVRMLALEYETRELSLAYEKAKDSEKAKIKADLKKGLSELFDLRLGHQEFRVKRMEKDLARLKSQIEKRKSSKAKLVEGRLEQLTGEAMTW